MAILEKYWDHRKPLDTTDPDTPGVLCYVAQWVDAGWRDTEVVQQGLAAFPQGERGNLGVIDYAHVLMAEGALYVAREDVARARTNFELVLSLGPEIGDLQLLSLAHFWKCRCHRKQGEYDAALEDVKARLPSGLRRRHATDGGGHAGGRELASVPNGQEQRRAAAAGRSGSHSAPDRRLHHPGQHRIQLWPHVPPRRPLRPLAAPLRPRYR